jgi:alpha-L-fucosidase
MCKSYSAKLVLLAGVLVCAGICLWFWPVKAAEAKPPAVSKPVIAAEPAAPETEAQRTAWYREAKFGMFIHWGPYSVASVEASWPIMEPEAHWNITEAQYVTLFKRFNPTQYDPKAWVALAQQAGQRYMVFTTKHHDGFDMFDSALTDYKITNTPYGKDVTVART